MAETVPQARVESRSGDRRLALLGGLRTPEGPRPSCDAGPGPGSRKVSAIDYRIEPIPEGARTSTGPQQMWIWAGANVAPVNLTLGALGIALGLGLAETVAVIVLGNAIGCAIFASFTVMGHRTGVNQMVLCRSAFGLRGAYLPSALTLLMTLGWTGLNTYFPVKIVMGLLAPYGVSGTPVQSMAAVALIMAAQVGLGLFGIRAIQIFEKYVVPSTFVILALMSALAWTRTGVVDWHLHSGLPPRAWLAMLSLLTTAIGVGWGISWVTFASDYSRFVTRAVTPTSVFWYSYVGMLVPTIWLGLLGATIASGTRVTDPATMAATVFHGWSIAPVLLLILCGSITSNALNVYSGAIAVRSMDLGLNRAAFALFVGLAGFSMSMVFVFSPDFAKAFNAWMSGLLLWMSAFCGVVLADYYLVRRGDLDVRELYGKPRESVYGDVNWGGVGAFLIGVAIGWMLEDGVAPGMRGPISQHLLAGADLSWFGGIIGSGTAYLLLGGGKQAAGPR